MRARRRMTKLRRTSLHFVVPARLPVHVRMYGIHIYAVLLLRINIGRLTDGEVGRMEMEWRMQ